MEIEKPYALFLGDAHDDLAAKVAFGIAYWRPRDCVGQIRLPGCASKLDMPDLNVRQARDTGARTLLVGVANRGGQLSESWYESLHEAVQLGMNITSGLHIGLDSVPGLEAAARKNGVQLQEVRKTQLKYPVASGRPRSGRRLLTVGTDCSVGKMFTALAIEQELLGRGVAADFRATGQTGIMIAGSGVPVDAVISDFISGSIEQLCASAPDDHWDVIEGQGSLFHPSYAGVSLGLLHGAQASDLVLCHQPGRAHMRGLPDRELPSLNACIEANLYAARIVDPSVQFSGIAINTQAMEEASARTLLEGVSNETGLPTVDPVRFGVVEIVNRMLKIKSDS